MITAFYTPLLASVFKSLSNRNVQSMPFMKNGGVVKIHIHSSNEISSPSVQALLQSLIYLRSYKQKTNKSIT